MSYEGGIGVYEVMNHWKVVDSGGEWERVEIIRSFL